MYEKYSVEAILSVADQGFTEAITRAERAADALDESARTSSTGVTGIGKAFAVAQVGIKLAGKAIDAVVGSVDSAVSRVDTLNQYPKMLEQMGYGADSADQSIQTLSKGIQGLPTRLDEVASTSQRFVQAFKDVDKATDTTLALNNALLASGAQVENAKNATDQYVKMMSSGKLEMDTWNTLSESMGYALNVVSENLGYSATSSWELYEALKNGDVTLEAFNDALIEANQAQGGFAEHALTASEGLRTSWTNIQTAISTGVANSIEALDELITELTGTGIAGHLDKVKVAVSNAFKAIAQAIRNSTPYIRKGIQLFEMLLPVITGVMSAFASYKAISSFTSAVEKSGGVIQAFSKYLDGMGGDSKLAQTAVSGLQGGLKLLTGEMSLATAGKALLAKSAALLASPMGIVAISVGAVAGGLALLAQNLPPVSEEMSNLQTTTDETATKVNDLMTELGNNQTAYENEITAIENTEQAHKDLLGRLDDILQKEEATSTERATAKTIVDQLNGSIEGLGLAYDEETNSLNMSTKALRWNIEQRAELQRNQAKIDRLIDLDTARRDLEVQLKQLDEQRAEANRFIEEYESLFDKTIRGDLGEGESISDKFTSVDVAKETRETAKQAYEESAQMYQDIIAEQALLEAEVVEGYETMAVATEDGTGRQIIALQDLSDEQKSVIEALKSGYQSYADVATDMFGKIETESDTSIWSMIDNLRHNQQALADYASNMQTIEENIGDLDPSGQFLETLRDLGPEAAGEVSNIANSVGTEDFETLVTTFSEGGENALEAFKTAMGLEEFEIEGLDSIITDAEASLAEQIESSGLNQLGADIVDGISEGITSNAESANTASGELGTGILESFQASLGISSPSTAFITAGGDIIDGLVQGVTGTQDTAVTAMSNLGDLLFTTFSDEARVGMTNFNEALLVGFDNAIVASQSGVNQIVNIFNSLAGRLESAGRNAGAGFALGLNSQSDWIMSVARNIANDVSDTIDRALDMNSPSRVMFDKGVNTVDGLIGGMENRRGKLREVTDSIAQLMIPAGSDFRDITFKQSSNSMSSSGLIRQAIEGGQDIYMDGYLVGQVQRGYVNENLGEDASLAGRHQI